MGLLSRKSAPRLDEARLLSEPMDAALDIPARLRDATPGQYNGERAQVDRLIDALAVYRQHRIRLREANEQLPTLRIDLAASIDSLPRDVVLVGADGRSRRMGVQALLDANTVLAKFSKLFGGWRVRPQHLWSDWDRAVAWAEESHDPHGGAFDLPAAWRVRADHALPLFGWTLDIGAGVLQRHDVAVIKLRHPKVTSVRYVPLFDVSKCFKRGQTAAERIRSRPVRLPPPPGQVWSQGWFRSASLSERLVVIDRISHEPDAHGEVVQVSVDALLALNPDLAELLEALADHELTELRRRLETHASAHGYWVANAALRAEVRRPYMPLTGWTLGDGAFDRLKRGEVMLRHRVDPDPLVVSARQAIDMMRREVPPSDRLFGDPCVSPEGQRVFVRSVDPHGCWVTAEPESPVEDARAIPHGAWIQANPDLARVLLQCLPDLGIRSKDAELRVALREARDVYGVDLSDWKASLSVHAPVTESIEAARVAKELLERGNVGIPTRWRDIDGSVWRWVGLEDGCFAFVTDQVLTARRAITGPDHDAWEGNLIEPDQRPDTTRLLTPEQLTFASPALARAAWSWQVLSGVVARDGELQSHGTRIARSVQRSRQTLVELIQRTKKHLQMSKALHEGPKRARVMQRHIDRLQTNHDDLKAGRGAYVWIREEQLPRTGVGLAAGGASSASRRACDDRLRITEGIRSHYLGLFQVAMVGGGDAYQEDPTGPLVAALLNTIEDRLADTLFDAVDLEEAQARTLEAVLAASSATGRKVPFCSFAALITHLDSGTAWVIWSGNSRLWRYRMGQEDLHPITTDHSFDGLVALAREAGLSEADAVQAILLLRSSAGSRRDLEAVPDEELIREAERYQTPARRRAIRAALGGAEAGAVKRHKRLLKVLSLYAEAYGRPLRLDTLEKSRAMVFMREVRVRAGDRLVLATDGMSVLAEHRPLWVTRALSRPDPQRAVEWLLEGVTELDGHADDLAVIALDPLPSRDFHSAFTRHQGALFHFCEDHRGLHKGGVVLGVPDGEYPGILLVQRRLSKWFTEVEDLVKRRRIPSHEKNVVKAAEAVAEWASQQQGTKDPTRRPGVKYQPLHEALEERHEDPLPRTLLAMLVLQRWRLAVRLVRGMRIEGVGDRQILSDVCWLEVGKGRDRFVLDVMLVRKLGTMSLAQAYGGAKIVRTRLLGMGRREAQITYVPDTRSVVGLPYDDTPTDHDPWLHLNYATRPPPPPKPEPVVPASTWDDDDDTDTPIDEEPEEEEPPVKTETKVTSDGFLDLDF